MEEQLRRYREEISAFMIQYLDSKKKDLSDVNIWAEDSIERLKKYALNGKLVRGSLIMMSSSMFGRSEKNEAVKAACAIELIHSALLIHDDIMDRDNMRRGSPSIHFQYETLADEKGFHDPLHFGISMAICVGDIAFFLAMDLVSSMDIDIGCKKKIEKVFSDTICKVGFAQMQDVNFEYVKGDVSEKEILDVYRYKTARYTFSLPLMVGALIAGKDDAVVDKLRLVGEDMGIVFQIKDDELGIFADEKELGKSIGIDIRSDKKTIYRHYLLTNASESEMHILKKIFGNNDIDVEDVQLVRDLIVSKGVLDTVVKKIRTLEANSKSIIEDIGADEDSKKILLSLLYYNASRKR